MAADSCGGSRGTIVLLLAVVMAVGAMGAEAQVGQRISVLQVDVRQGSQGAFEEFVRHYKKAADEIGTVPSWVASSPAIGPTTTYSFSRPFSSFLELAEPMNPMAQVYSAEEIARLQEVYRDAVLDSRTMVFDVRPDLSRPRPEDSPEPEVAMATLIEVKPGKQIQFEIYAKKVREATAEVAPRVYWTMFAPDIAAGTRYAVWAPTTWAELDRRPPPISQRLLEAFGRRQGQEIYASGLDAIASVSEQLRRIRPDLSHTATSSGAE